MMVTTNLDDARKNILNDNIDPIRPHDGPNWPTVGPTVWPCGHKWPFWPHLAIYGHVAIGPCPKNMGNVAQQS